jgi:hypothetical protein
MCYTLNTSINTFIINIVFCFILYVYANIKQNIQLKIISLFFLYVGVMQFWDILFWINDENTETNKYATKMAMIWNHFEPIVLFFLILFYLHKIPNVSLITIIIYSVLMIGYTAYNWNKVKKTSVYIRELRDCKDSNKNKEDTECKTRETKNSLFWEWNYMEGSMSFYTIFLITLLVLSYKNFSGWIRNLSLFYILFTFFFSLYKYKIDKGVGRFWCYFASYGPIFYLLTSCVIV